MISPILLTLWNFLRQDHYFLFSNEDDRQIIIKAGNIPNCLQKGQKNDKASQNKMYFRLYSTPKKYTYYSLRLKKQKKQTFDASKGKICNLSTNQIYNRHFGIYICFTTRFQITISPKDNKYLQYSMQQDTRKCDLCGAQIVLRCFDIHNRACTKKFSKSTMKPFYSKNNTTDLIPCTECGEMIDFSIFSIHMEECVGRQLTKCPKCKLLYPTFLFDEHAGLCDVYREEEPQEIIALQYEDEEEDEMMQNMIRTLAKVNTKNDEEPLSLDKINKMKKEVTVKTEECSICYCEIAKKSTIFKLHCPHKYHTKCITAWLQKNPHCPMCRRHALY